MKSKLKHAALERHCHDGWWPYMPGKSPSLEATAWCSIACRKNIDLANKSLSYLLNMQNEDGGWSTEPGVGPSDWTSSLAMLAIDILRREILLAESDDDGGVSARAIQSFERGLTFLSGNRSELYNNVSKVILMIWKGPDYDYPRGWPWTPNTFHWVEPTSYALLALKPTSYARQKRYQEMIGQASEYLLQKSCTTGGWNYGCKTVLGVNLEPIPMTTCLALLALQDNKQHPVVEKALSYLKQSAQTENTLLALSWSTLALDALGQDTVHLRAQLSSRQSADGSSGENLVISALSTIAISVPNEGNPLKLKADA